MADETPPPMPVPPRRRGAWRSAMRQALADNPLEATRHLAELTVKLGLSVTMSLAFAAYLIFFAPTQSQMTKLTTTMAANQTATLGALDRSTAALEKVADKLSTGSDKTASAVQALQSDLNQKLADMRSTTSYIAGGWAAKNKCPPCSCPPAPACPPCPAVTVFPTSPPQPRPAAQPEQTTRGKRDR